MKIVKNFDFFDFFDFLYILKKVGLFEGEKRFVKINAKRDSRARAWITLLSPKYRPFLSTHYHCNSCLCAVVISSSCLVIGRCLRACD